MTDHPALQRLLHHYQSMPPVAAMQLSIADYDGQRLRLHAPLAVHVNDKGCAFGGSLVTLQLEAVGLPAEVYVADSQLRYRAPLFADLDVEAELDDGSDWHDFASTLRSRGRARTAVRARVHLPDGGIATEFNARYVAIARA